MEILLRPEAVKRLAALQNKTFRELAHDAGMHETYLHRLMRHEHEPSARIRRRMCERWGVTFEEIFTIRGEVADDAS